MTNCPACLTQHDADACPACATEHEKACRRNPVYTYGRRIPARNLDQQEGNAEEYFGGTSQMEWRA